MSLEDGTLSIGYRDVPWQNFLRWIDGKSWNGRAAVTVAVPAGARVEVGVVGACAVVSGITGGTDLRSVSGDSTLVGLDGGVRADTVSGLIEAQAVTGDLSFKSVSGDLTLLDGSGSRVRADSVTGDMVLDLAPSDGNTNLSLTTVSGEVALRLPAGTHARVEANVTRGPLSNDFDELRITEQWGAKRISGTLGTGGGLVKATTVSGALALLRRPAPEDIDEPGGGVRSPQEGPPGPGDTPAPPTTPREADAHPAPTDREVL